MVAVSRMALLEQLRSNAFTFQTGIERETLRATPEGHISQNAHPTSLGSALTHNSITTDYSESLLEFITGVHQNKEELIQELTELHQFATAQLDNEQLWPSSMPTQLPEQTQIPIAQYGKSHIGQLKTIYRHGLWHRYGRKMQTIAGVHYNWSLCDEFWQQWALLNGQHGDLTPFMTNEYFGLIRNFRRHSWLLLYLFGASPAADVSFIDNPPESLNKLGDATLSNDYATTLRMSDMGYSNKAQAELFVCFNSLETYAKTLSEAIESPYPAYDAIGLKDGEVYKQLNTSILQIENEYYSDIRPKRVAFSGEKPLHALRYRGVEYIEVRCLDVNPFLPLGIDEPQMHFVDLFLLWCLVQDSPEIDLEECQALKENNQRIAAEGRSPNAKISANGELVSLKTQGDKLMASIRSFAELLDAKNGTTHYQATCQAQQAKIDDVAKTPSAQVAAQLSDQHSFIDFSNQQAQTFAAYFSTPLMDDRNEHWQNEALASWQKQSDIENADMGSFDAFLKEYLSQN